MSSVTQVTAKALVYYAFVLTVVIFTFVLHNSAFFSVENWLNIVRQTAPVVIMAIGLNFALSVGMLDLSIGAVVALSGLVAAMLLPDYGVMIASVVAFSLGGAIGAFNGYLSLRLAIPSLIVTLGTMVFLSGFVRYLSGLESIPILNKPFLILFGGGSLFGLPSLLFWVIGIAACVYCIFNYLQLGRRLLATGANSNAAQAMGVDTDKIRIIAMSLSGMFAALAGLLYAGRMQSARYTLGESELITVIAAVAIGGGSLMGGQVSIWGAVLGVWLIGVLNNGLILSGFSSNAQMMMKGIILVVAVGITYRARKS
ncbi:ABC transporter permease [Pseudoalteromonas luteoviolacea]|uniref:ABC transporter permease n=1 Tax=Pseudoalteromonas luteoviolacea TaxID=43657 RepID=UPI001B36F6A6|nr:ABC transporter permease [Pseudoalteromonas luteoviolacea]MBQ4811689.1 ABC transporter permease [Pseudoalteromonas luteoviolacea]